MAEQIGLRYGAISDPISEQLAKQGYMNPKVDFWQQCADAITMLDLQGILTDSQANQARQKLNDRITKDCRPTN